MDLNLTTCMIMVVMDKANMDYHPFNGPLIDIDSFIYLLNVG